MNICSTVKVNDKRLLAIFKWELSPTPQMFYFSYLYVKSKINITS